jgi:hexosaminidase
MMKRFFLFFFLISSVSFLYGQMDKNLNLMPVPTELKVSEGKFRVDTTFTISVRGEADNRLYREATRMLRRLDGRTGLFFKQDIIKADASNEDASLIIKCNRPGEVRLHEDESYSLRIAAKEIRLDAECDIGAIRGLETLLQLLHTDEIGYFFPAVTIQDQPRFPWRGLLIDVCRHFMPVGVIKRNIDAMAAVKLNVLHLHLTEDQGFRIESKTFPKLHQLGSDGFYFTHAQIKDIIAYADQRGIRVMPEFDMPGHTTSWFVGYPKLASAPGPYSIERTWGIQDPVMDPTREKTYEFLDAFFKEMTALFPDEYFHIGGDENNGKQWAANEDIQEFMKQNDFSDQHALQRYFNQRVLALLSKHGKKMVGWDEIFQPELPKSIVIHSWRGKKALVEAAKQGYQSILSNGYYIDLIHSAENHYLNDPLPEETELSDDEKKNILGGEATMWAEMITEETIDSRIWPRTAAIAERLWSSRNIDDVDDMYRRLEPVSIHLEELGLTHIKNINMLLRRLARQYDVSTLRIFVDAVEPVKGYTRHHQGVRYYSYSPLTRVVDAAQPDSKVGRRFSRLVDRFIREQDINLTDEMRYWLELWYGNHSYLFQIIRKAPVLEEIESLSYDLSLVSRFALESLDAWEANVNLSPSWYQHAAKALETAKKPRGQVELAVLDSIKKLIMMTNIGENEN